MLLFQSPSVTASRPPQKVALGVLWVKHGYNQGEPETGPV